MRFQGKAVIVSGAGSGIGAAVAVLLAAEGASLVLCGRRPAPLEKTVADCEGARGGGRFVAAPLDVRDETALADAFERADSLGPLEAAIACHGINRLAPAEQMRAEDWNEVVSTNLTGTFLFAREAARRMRPAGRGRIVLVSSISGRPGYRKFPGFAAYASSKYALTGLHEILTVELEGSGVGISLICPAGVDTEMFRATFPGSRAELSAEKAASAIVDQADPQTAPPSGTIFELA